MVACKYESLEMSDSSTIKTLFNRYTEYLAAFELKGAYLKKKGKTELGSKMIYLKMRNMKLATRKDPWKLLQDPVRSFVADRSIRDNCGQVMHYRIPVYVQQIVMLSTSLLNIKWTLEREVQVFHSMEET